MVLFYVMCCFGVIHDGWIKLHLSPWSFTPKGTKSDDDNDENNCNCNKAVNNKVFTAIINKIIDVSL